jgi:glucokinase
MDETSAAEPVIGIDLGGTNITGGLVDPHNKLTARVKIDTEADGGADHVVERLAECIDRVIKESNTSREQIMGVGIGVPGAIDPDTGRVLEAVNLRWRDMPLCDRLRKAIDLPVTIDNDVNVGTWGEYARGAAQGFNAVMGIFVGTGIGGGLVLGGRLYSGAFGTAGEIGHTVVQAHAPRGMRTLEQLASRTAVVNRLVQLVNANQASVLPELAGKKWPHIRSKILARAYQADDPLTVAILEDAAAAIGTAIASAVTVLSLDCVVIGGGLTEALNARWVKVIRNRFREVVFPSACRECRIVASKLGDDAGVIGAALLARARLPQQGMMVDSSRSKS